MRKGINHNSINIIAWKIIHTILLNKNYIYHLYAYIKYSLSPLTCSVSACSQSSPSPSDGNVKSVNLICSPPQKKRAYIDCVYSIKSKLILTLLSKNFIFNLNYLCLPECVLCRSLETQSDTSFSGRTVPETLAILWNRSWRWPTLVLGRSWVLKW